jgi:type IV secretory pathway VirB4 component
MGTNEHNNSLVILDSFNLKKYKAPHMCLMGCTGSGKTFILQTIATRLRRKHVKTFIIAPIKGHEFKRAADAIGGSFIRLSPGSPNCINILEIRKKDHAVSAPLDGEIEEQSCLAMKVDSLLIFFRLIHPDMSNLEEQILDEALMKTYAEFGITNNNDSLLDPEDPARFRKMPILEDLHRHLRENPRTEQMAIILGRFVYGSARSMFNGQTNVDLSNSYTVIDLTYLKNKIMLSAGMFVALDMVWDKAQQNRLEQKAIVIDEVWQLIGSNSNALAAEYVVEIAKVARAYNTAAIFATQDINDCAKRCA